MEILADTSAPQVERFPPSLWHAVSERQGIGFNRLTCDTGWQKSYILMPLKLKK